MVNQDKVRELVTEICLERDWAISNIVWAEDIDGDHGEDTVLYLDPTQSYDNPAQLIGHLTCIIAQMNGVSVQEADKMYCLMSDSWEHRN